MPKPIGQLVVATPPYALLPSRTQMAFTLAYHITWCRWAFAFPLLTVVMEGIGLRRNDPVALRLARRWSVVMAVQFAVGAVTGTILSFEFGILWPRMMGRPAAARRLRLAGSGSRNRPPAPSCPAAVGA